MKIKFVMTGLLAFAVTASFAQKGELNNAQSNYDSFSTAYNPKVPANNIINQTALKSLNSAKESIDKASTNEKTANLPQTFAVKAAVYASLANLDSVSTTSAPKYQTAVDALKKAKELDTKNEFAKVNNHTTTELAQYNLTKGVKEYQSKDWPNAYKSFDAYRTLMPEDTNAIYYTGLAAVNAKNYPAAITNYNKLLTTNFSGKQQIYMDLSSMYLEQRDTANALKIINEGVAKFPSNANFRKREIEMSLQTGKLADVQEKMTAAIANDPKNKALYYYSGLTYSQLGDNAAKNLKTEKDPAKKAALVKSRDDNYAKAGDMYKKALEIDPNYFEANLNMGYILINPAIDAYNAANKLPANQQKQYEAAMAKAKLQFDAAKPYLLKAVELNPKSYDALNNLKTYYLGRQDAAHAKEVQAQMDALNK